MFFPWPFQMVSNVISEFYRFSGVPKWACQTRQEDSRSYGRNIAQHLGRVRETANFVS